MYNISMYNFIIATSLSAGELNQWILDIDKELAGFKNKDHQDNFRDDLGYRISKVISFEDYLYNSNFKNIDVRYKDVPLKIFINDGL